MRESKTKGQLVGTSLGEYEILALIAKGGTAEIYLARIGGAAGFQKYVVVKVLLPHLADDPEFVQMFADEARLGAQLTHSNIVKTLEFGQSDRRYYLVMDYLAGMSLAQIVKKNRKQSSTQDLPHGVVLALTAQACSGLDYAHNRSQNGKALNLIHRDISPQNLVVTYEGVLKIVDFGIAKSDVRETETRVGTIKGKFAYMSPEQSQSEPMDHRSDIFSLATVCHELLCNRRLFKRATTYDTFQAVIKGEVAAPTQLNPTLDPAVDEVLLKALAYKPEDRYQSAREFGDALLGILRRRGEATNPSDVAEFFQTRFPKEIQEHAEAMRKVAHGELDHTLDMSWDSDPPSAEASTPRNQHESTQQIKTDSILGSQTRSGQTRIRIADDDSAIGSYDDSGDTHDSSDTEDSSDSMDSMDSASMTVSGDDARFGSFNAITQAEAVVIPSIAILPRDDPPTVPEPPTPRIEMPTPTLRGAAVDPRLLAPKDHQLPLRSVPSPAPPTEPRSEPSFRSPPHVQAYDNRREYDHNASLADVPRPTDLVEAPPADTGQAAATDETPWLRAMMVFLVFAIVGMALTLIFDDIL